MKKWLAILALVLAVAPVQAVVYEVTKTADTLDGACNDDCSLREAVRAANLRKGLDVVRVGPGLYTLTRTGAEEDADRTGDLDVTDDLVILGAGADRTILDGAGADRVLESFQNVILEAHDVTIRHGSDRGIFAWSLRLVGCLVTENAGGGVLAYDAEIRKSTLSNNSNDGDQGGGLYGVLSLKMSDSTVSGNSASAGGGLVLPDSTDLSNVTITGNHAQEGGGIFVPSGGICEPACGPGTSYLHRSIVAGNSAAVDPDISTGDPLPSADSNFIGGDPRLSPLGDHGGPTPTHLPLPDSPVIGLVPPAQCSGHDQRGDPRPSGPSGCDAGAVELSAGCVPGADALCLGAGNRFKVTATWTALGTTGVARALPLTEDTGAFWFFGADNLEIQIKVLDGCTVNQHFWVFATGLTDVGVELTVEDTATGESWMYGHAGGTPFPTVTDTNAFATCP